MLRTILQHNCLVQFDGNGSVSRCGMLRTILQQYPLCCVCLDAGRFKMWNAQDHTATPHPVADQAGHRVSRCGMLRTILQLIRQPFQVQDILFQDVECSGPYCNYGKRLYYSQAAYVSRCGMLRTILQPVEISTQTIEAEPFQDVECSGPYCNTENVLHIAGLGDGVSRCGMLRTILQQNMAEALWPDLRFKMWNAQDHTATRVAHVVSVVMRGVSRCGMLRTILQL